VNFQRLFVAGLAVIPLVCAQRPPEAPAWAPKPVALPKYVAPHKPHTRLSDLLAKHQGEKNWREELVNDDYLHAEYIYSQPGSKVGKRFHPDTREWWIVMGGQIRFEIEGQQPIVAPKGGMVQVPMTTIYSMETVGDEPSLRLEVNIAKAKLLYPRTEEPPQLPGFTFVPVRVARQPGQYTNGNKPFTNFYEEAKAPNYRGGQFIHDDRAVSNIIYGYAPPATDAGNRGHYHAESSEFWLIMAGKISYKIEGQPFIVADVGDVVYVPMYTFHLAQHYGEGPSCRLAINGYTGLAHLYDPPVAAH
jgi:mannose-6-phosphate isomerase-like protein (cupin superfamily)